MKKSLLSLLFLIAVFVLSTGYQKEEFISPDYQVLTDSRDGREYKIIQLNGQWWMAENLNYDTGNAWYYNNQAAIGENHGRLYPWDQAMKACPEGWRLPTSEEVEQMIQSFGGLYAAFNALTICGDSGFEARLSGCRTSKGRFRCLGKVGFYWTSTEVDETDAWYYYFRSDYGRADEAAFEKTDAHSCRCVKE